MAWFIPPFSIVSRTALTRAACCVGLVSGMGALVLVITIWAMLFSGSRLPLGILQLAGALMLTAIALRGLLWTWRRCDRCGRRLFAEGMLTERDRQRDYRARRWLFSYRRGAMWRTAIRGRALCQWCGHEDGRPLDYVGITAGSEQ